MNRKQESGKHGGRRQQRESMKTRGSSSSRNEWKERLRSDCLQRARRKRIEVLSRARRTKEVSPLSGSNGETALRNVSNDGSTASEAARSIVQESLALSQESASNYSSPSTYAKEAPFSASSFTSPIPTQSNLSNQNFVFRTPQDRQTYVQKQEEILTEDELISLMREVEEELQKEEATLLREMEEAENNSALEEKILEDQIAAYELWENEGVGSMDVQMEVADSSTNSVRCPVCEMSQVIVTNAGVILCRRFDRNSPNNGCSLRIDSHTEGMSLPTFKEMLNEAYTRHGQMCSCRLSFRMQQAFGIVALHALCDGCGSDVIVV